MREANNGIHGLSSPVFLVQKFANIHRPRSGSQVQRNKQPKLMRALLKVGVQQYARVRPSQASKFLENQDRALGRRLGNLPLFGF
jgi:hypothetical protein